LPESGEGLAAVVAAFDLRPEVAPTTVAVAISLRAVRRLMGSFIGELGLDRDLIGLG
jgi:hypothetical protein